MPVERVRESGSAELLAPTREESRASGAWSASEARPEIEAGEHASRRAKTEAGLGLGEPRLLRALRARRARRRARVLGTEALEVEDLLSLLGIEERARPTWDGALASLVRLAPEEVSARLGARMPQAWRLAAALELGRRVAVERSLERPVVRGPADVQRLLGDLVQGEEREQFHVLLLDGKHRLKARHTVSVGSLSSSIVHPREVFRPAVRVAAAAVLCAHNHPSGDPEPSPEDVAVTQRLDQAGKLLGIPLLDHVVLGDRSWVSMRQRLGL
jgi:DNA repair protein RadC